MMVDRKMTLALYRQQCARTQAWLSRSAQIRAGLELEQKRPMTDEILAYLTPDDLVIPNGSIEYLAEAT